MLTLDKALALRFLEAHGPLGRLLPDALHTAAVADWPRLDGELVSAVEDSPLPTSAPQEAALEGWLLEQRRAYWS